MNLSLTKTKITFLCILLLALLTRLVNLGSLPRHLHQDEIMNGYVGRFVLENGKDLYGNRWPLLYFDNFGDYPNIIPMYVSGIFTYIFGLSEFAIRFPIALAGAIAVVPIFLISRMIFRSNTTGLVSALFIALNPWHIVLSRATAEAILGSTIFLFGVWLLLYALEKKSKYYTFLSFFLYLSTYFLYPSFRLLVPMFFIITSIIYVRHSLVRILLGFSILSLLLTAGISNTHWGSARFKQTSVFYFNNAVVERIHQYARDAGPNQHLSLKVFNNKAIVFSREIIRQYLSYWSPQFLFSDGGRPHRYLVPDQGLFPISLLAITVLCIGAVFFTQSKPLPVKIHRNALLLLALLIVIAPFSAALTLDEVPNVHRSAIFGVLLIFFFTYMYRCGLILIRHYRPFVILFWIIFGAEALYFIHQYQVLSPEAQSVTRYDQRTVLAKQVIEKRDDYDKIIVPREIFAIYYLFYSGNLKSELAGKFSKNLYIPQVDNVYFIDMDCPTIEGHEDAKKFLLIQMSYCEQLGTGFKVSPEVQNNLYNIYEPVENKTSEKPPAKAT